MCLPFRHLCYARLEVLGQLAVAEVAQLLSSSLKHIEAKVVAHLCGHQPLFLQV